jgi:hypothetical protein
MSVSTDNVLVLDIHQQIFKFCPEQIASCANHSRTKSAPTLERVGALVREKAELLISEMRERLISFCHSMRILTLLHSSAFVA